METPIGEEQRDIYTVTQLNREAAMVLGDGFPRGLWVRGEISNLAQPGSGHIYFSIKDKRSQVRCAMFRNANSRLKFPVENGMEVLVRANVGLYETRGDFQLTVEQMEQAGSGALQQAFEKLKQRLLEEGLFAPEHKLPLPAYPGTIGVITSTAGAVIRDIIQVLARRYPLAGIIVYPVRVQGAGSAEQIVQALHTANQRRECDALILARGGGSLEDLWSFNEESVARAIHVSAIPVISAVGHETDFTIADFVADRRAPTPSAAAELVSPDAAALRERLDSLHSGLCFRITGLLDAQRNEVTQLFKRLPRPVHLLHNLAQRTDDLSIRLKLAINNGIVLWRARLDRLNGAIRERSPAHQLERHRTQCAWLDTRLRERFLHALRARREKLDSLSRTLDAVSPLATLERGYAIVTDERENIIRRAGQLRENALITAKFSRGSAQATVGRVNPEDES